MSHGKIRICPINLFNAELSGHNPFGSLAKIMIFKYAKNLVQNKIFAGYAPSLAVC